MSLSMLPQFAYALDDLEPVLVRASGNHQLLSSDHPVVFYNKWCEKAQGVGVTGAVSSGLIVLLPLPPRLLLLLYDRAVYRIHRTSGGEVLETNTSDVRQMNILQAIWAEYTLFGSLDTNEEQMRRVASSAAQYRSDSCVRVARAVSDSNGTGEVEAQSTLLHAFREQPNVGLELQFLGIVPRAAGIPMNRRFNMFRKPLPSPESEKYPAPEGPHQWKKVDEW